MLLDGVGGGRRERETERDKGEARLRVTGRERRFASARLRDTRLCDFVF